MIAAYIRVSSKQQNLTVKRAEITRWLAANMPGVPVAFYEDKRTGKNVDREGFQALQRAIFDGTVKTVVVWKIDRLARSMRDGINVVDDWMRREVRLVSVTQQIDMSGITGRVMVTLLFAFAEMENELRRERQAPGIEAAKAEGKYKGRKPGTTKKKPAQARELRERGRSVSEIAAIMKLGESTVRRYLAQST